jgi:hypothetical protein
MQIQFIGVSDSESIQYDLDAVPRAGDFVVLKGGNKHRVERIEWDLSDRKDLEPLGARMVRVYCAS